MTSLTVSAASTPSHAVQERTRPCAQNTCKGRFLSLRPCGEDSPTSGVAVYRDESLSVIIMRLRNLLCLLPGSVSPYRTLAESGSFAFFRIRLPLGPLPKD